MKSKFADWYKVIDMTANKERLEARWSSINNFIEIYGQNNILSIALNYLGMVQNDDIKQKMVECLIENDMSFDKNSEKEIRLLSGIVLAQMIEDEPIEISLAVKCLFLFMNNMIAPDLCQLFEGRFMQECINLREDLLILEKVNIEEQNEVISEDLGIATTWNANTLQIISNILTEFNNNITKLRSAHNLLVTHTQIFEEESKILSWIVGESSNDLHKTLKETKQDDVAIVIGKEMADLISVLPGPYAAEAFIKKMLSLCKKGQQKKYTLANYIDTLNPEWKTELLKQYSLISDGNNTPIMLAVLKSTEVDNSGEWLPAYKKLSGIDASAITLLPDTLAYQVYLECLLIKSMNR